MSTCPKCQISPCICFVQMNKGKVGKAIATSENLGVKLMKALGLPETTTWFEIRCEPDRPVTVKCAYYADLQQDALVEMLAEYELHPVDHREA